MMARCANVQPGIFQEGRGNNERTSGEGNKNLGRGCLG